MAKYKIEYGFDYDGVCLWPVNEEAHKKYGVGGINGEDLPISGKLQMLLRYLQAYYDNRLDWDNAPDISPWWTEDDDIMFAKKAKFAFEQLRKELGDDYEIVYRVG